MKIGTQKDCEDRIAGVKATCFYHRGWTLSEEDGD